MRRDASLAEIRISYRRSTQILAPERFASANETVRTEAARRTRRAQRRDGVDRGAARSPRAAPHLGSLSFGGPAVAPAAEPSMRSTAVVDEPPPLRASSGARAGARSGRSRRPARPKPPSRARQTRSPSPMRSRRTSPRSRRRRRGSTRRERRPRSTAPPARPTGGARDRRRPRHRRNPSLRGGPGRHRGRLPAIGEEPSEHSHRRARR